MGKIVTSYLINGDPKGTQYSFITNKICLMLEPQHPRRSSAAPLLRIMKNAVFLSALIGHFPKNTPYFIHIDPHSSHLIPFRPHSSTLIHIDPHRGFRALYLCSVTREEEARLPNL